MYVCTYILSLLVVGYLTNKRVHNPPKILLFAADFKSEILWVQYI